MKSQEVFESCVQKYLVSSFALLGFKYSSSQKTFFRKVDDFKQAITFCFNRYNGPELIDFWSMWEVSSTVYEKWFVQQWQEKPANKVIGGSRDQAIPGWYYAKTSLAGHFDLTQSGIHEETMKNFLKNTQESGLPYLEKISDWCGAAENLIEKKWFYDKAVDFYLIAQQKEKAKQIAIQGLKYYSLEKKHDNFNEVAKLKKRLLKYWNIQENEILKT